MEKKLSAWCKNAKIEMINRDLKTTNLTDASSASGVETPRC